MKVLRSKAEITCIELIVLILNCAVSYRVITGDVEAMKGERKMNRCLGRLRKLQLLPALYTNEHKAQVETVATISLEHLTLSPGVLLLNP